MVEETIWKSKLIQEFQSLPDHKGLKYNSPETLPGELEDFLHKEYQDHIYPETLAIIIGPFKKYESDDEESDIYYEVKKIYRQGNIIPIHK